MAFIILLSKMQRWSQTSTHSPSSFFLRISNWYQTKATRDLAMNSEKEEAGFPIKTFENNANVISPPTQLASADIKYRFDPMSGSAYTSSNSCPVWDGRRVFVLYSSVFIASSSLRIFLWGGKVFSRCAYWPSCSKNSSSVDMHWQKKNRKGEL